MNRGVDCKDTVYEVTFNSESEGQLRKLMFILEGLYPEEFFEIHTSGSVTSFIVTVYEDLDYK